MDRHRARKGLRRGVVTTQRAVLTSPSVLGMVGTQHGAVASPCGINSGLSPNTSFPPFHPAGSTGLVPDDFDFTRRDDRFYPPRSAPVRHTESDLRSVTFSTLHRGRSQRPRSTAAFSLYRQGPDENASNMDGKPVRISNVRAQRKKRKQRFELTRCRGCDLRFSFPHSGRYLHFLFQSARIGVGLWVLVG